MLDSKTISIITAQIHRRFPETSNSQPKVRSQPVPKGAGASELKGNGVRQYLLTFQGSAAASNGKSIPRCVRVVVNAQGKILKITTSH